MTLRSLLSVGLMALGLTACRNPTPQPGDVRAPEAMPAAAARPPVQPGPLWVEIGGQRYTVEIADDPWEQQKGLMHRRHLPEHHGMLFIYDREAPMSYWMKNTWIPLDILYFNSRLELVAQQRQAQPCPTGTPCPSYPSGVPARYVLEINGGQAEALGLKNGDRLTVRPDMLIPSP
jgi:hypothetical protein